MMIEEKTTWVEETVTWLIATNIWFRCILVLIGFWLLIIFVSAACTVGAILFHNHFFGLPDEPSLFRERVQNLLWWPLIIPAQIWFVKMVLSAKIKIGKYRLILFKANNGIEI